jgi:hypothetical protein
LFDYLLTFKTCTRRVLAGCGEDEQVNCSWLLKHFNTTGIFHHISLKLPSTKIHENPFGCYRVFIAGQTEGQTEIPIEINAMVGYLTFAFI